MVRATDAAMRTSQQWFPTASLEKSAHGERTTLSNHKVAVTMPLPQPSTSAFTPDATYFFQRQQRGRPLSARAQQPRVGSMRVIPPPKHATPRQPEQAGLDESLPAEAPDENTRLRFEAGQLKELMRSYEEAPRPRSRRGPADYARPTTASASPRQWSRPASSRGDPRVQDPHGDARSCGPRASAAASFAMRDMSPRGGSLGLSELPSRLASAPPASRTYGESPRVPNLLLRMPPPSATAAAADVAADGSEGEPPSPTTALFEQLSDSELARAAAEAGVTPALHGASASADGRLFNSHAVRFAVTLAEQLERSAEHARTPTTEGCYTCLAVLREMLPLLGPLAPVLQNIHDALSLCLLSETHYSEAAFLNDASSPLRTKSAPAGRGTARGGRSSSSRRQPDGDGGGGIGRVPYFVLVRKLEEAAAALRLERDNALEEVTRHEADLANVDEQLSKAKAQLQQKTATIDKLMREQAGTEVELKHMREVTLREEHKYEVLQTE